MKRFAIVAAMLAAACGYTEDQYAEEGAEAGCAVSVNCFEAYATVDECLADDTGGTDDTECLNFDATAAQACVEGLEAIADNCPADPMDFEFPTSCFDVCEIEADTGMDSEGTEAM